jgi:hypothetical protein
MAADWRDGVIFFFHTGFIAEKSAPRQSTFSLRCGMAVDEFCFRKKAVAIGVKVFETRRCVGLLRETRCVFFE